MFVVLQGLPAVRKSSAVRIGTKLLKKAGYNKFAPDRMSRQSLLDEMAKLNKLDEEDIDAILDAREDDPNEMTIHATEFADLIGMNDVDYLLLLTKLYDNEDEYRNPRASKRDLIVKYPTVNLLSANTPSSLATSFPTNTVQNGTFSRIIFVHGEHTGKYIAFPSPPDKDAEQAMVKRLVEIKENVRGQAIIDPDARGFIEELYVDRRFNSNYVSDPRFINYNGRRQSHLMKLALVCAAARCSTTVSGEDALLANTILSATEHCMPDSLGQFGMSVASRQRHLLFTWLREQGGPVKIKDIWRRFISDFGKEIEFQSMMFEMLEAGILKHVITESGENLGYMVVDAPFRKDMIPYIHADYLTDQERGMIGL